MRTGVVLCSKFCVRTSYIEHYNRYTGWKFKFLHKERFNITFKTMVLTKRKKNSLFSRPGVVLISILYKIYFT